MLIRVYYEDTDAAGVVYHSNYLNYFERARTEHLRERGCSVAELAMSGSVFPVVKMEIDFKAPARHDDLLRVTTIPVKIGGSSFQLRQQVLRDSDGRLLVDALVTLACVSTELKARRIPGEVRAIFTTEIENP
jgi:acyl-CoA thioester hydrolase